MRRLRDNLTQHFGAAVQSLGAAAWVSADGVDLVLNSIRGQTFHPEAMTNLDLDPTTRKIVVVKSTQHFYAGFAPIAKQILYVGAPGALAPNFDRIPYTKLTRPYWPKVEDPVRRLSPRPVSC